MSLFPASLISSLLGLNIFISVLFSNNLSPCLYLNVTCKVTSRIILKLYFIIYLLLITNEKTDNNPPNVNSHSLGLVCSYSLDTHYFDLLLSFPDI